MKSIWKLAVLILFDQMTKGIFFPLHGVKNYGLPFGIDLGYWNLIVVLAGLIFFVIYFFTMKKTEDLVWILIIAGALSNILDRIMFGFVRDFLNFGLNFTANFADILIVTGLLLIFINEFKLAKTQ